MVDEHGNDEGRIERSASGEDRFSGMAWAFASKDKNPREIAGIHEEWGKAMVEESLFDKAQRHLDQALEIYEDYEEEAPQGRLWCLKGTISCKEGDFSTASKSFKRAQKLAKEAGDTSLLLRAMANRPICEMHKGDHKAADSQVVRALTIARASGNLDLVAALHSIRAICYQMVGDFNSACQEHEAALSLVSDGGAPALQPEQAIATETNFGISLLSSGEAVLALERFQHALGIARQMCGGCPPLVLARCLYHAGEAARAGKDLNEAIQLLDEAISVAISHSGLTQTDGTKGRARGDEQNAWSALMIEICNSRGLCTVVAATVGFDISRSSLGGREAGKAAVSSGEGGWAPEPRAKGESGTRDGPEQTAGAETAQAAARLIVMGGNWGEEGANLLQKASNAALEGIVLSMAEKGSPDAGRAMKRAETLAEKIQGICLNSSKPMAAECVSGAGTAIGNRKYVQLAGVELGIVCDLGVAYRGGIGLGVACTTGKAGEVFGGPQGSQARRASRVTAAGWSDAIQVHKRQVSMAMQAPPDDQARELSVAWAHQGAVDFVMGKPDEAAGHFSRQHEQAQRAMDPALEALAERNLADVCEADGNLHGTIAHLRRCLQLAREGNVLPLMADSCRRLATAYTEFSNAHPAPQDGGSGEEGGVLTDGLQEEEVAAREDCDLNFLKHVARHRAVQFSEMYSEVLLEQGCQMGHAWLPLGVPLC